MPELPEVESMKRYLSERVVGSTIHSLVVYNPNSLINMLTQSVSIVGSSITELHRVGKKLFIHLSNSVIICVHFKMSGSFYLRNHSGSIDVHDRVIFDIGSHLLCFHDPRKFGKILITLKGEDAHKNLGVDALSTNVDSPTLLHLLHSHKIGIKRFLLDQSYVSGIGNIYVDEILFASRIHPLTLSHRITSDECTLLVNNMKRILMMSIEKGGTSLGNGESNYQIQGKRGEYQHYLQVFGKKGLPCPVCSSLIEKIKVGGRSTHICPICQTL